MNEDTINVEEENVEDVVPVEEETVIVNIGGTTDYRRLSNKPSINDVELDGNKTSSDLGLADSEEITNLQEQIDAITVSSDVVDIVGTYQELQDYDTSKLTDDDIIKVMQDSTHSNAMSYYRWTVTNDVGAWVYVGSEGPFYTKSESDTLLRGKANISDLSTVATTGKYSDLIDNPINLLNIETGYITLTELLEEVETQGLFSSSYEAETEFDLYVSNENGRDTLIISPGDMIKISAIDYTGVVITTNGIYCYSYDGEYWSTNGKLLNEGEVDNKITQSSSSFVTTNTDQDITGMKTIRSNNGLRFRYGGNYVRMSIKPISTGMAIAYFDSQGNEANNMEFGQGYNTSNKNLIPKDNIIQNLGKSDKVWNNGYINTLSDGTNSVSVSNIATKTELAGKQDTLTAGTGIAITNNVISSTLEGIDYEVDQQLPATGEKGIIYLIPNGESETENIYDEYIWIPPLQEGESGRFEFIGTTQTDLSNYVTTDTAQDISGSKTFTSAITMKNNSRIKYANSYNSGCSIGNDGSGSMRFFNTYNTGTMDFAGSTLRPATASTNLDLGTSTIQWRDLYLKGKLSDGTNEVAVADIANKNNFVTLSQSDYDALTTKDPDTYYFIEEE